MKDATLPEDGPETETAFDPETGEVEETEAEESPDIEGIELDTLSGDLRDVMLTRFRDMQKPWEQMNEGEQYDFANGLELAAKDIVRRCTRLFTSYEWPHAAVQLGEIKIIGGDKSRIEGKVVASNIAEYRDVLGEHVNSHVMLVCVNSDTFMAERAPVKIDPDQPDLPDQELPDSADEDLETAEA